MHLLYVLIILLILYLLHVRYSLRAQCSVLTCQVRVVLERHDELRASRVLACTRIRQIAFRSVRTYGHRGMGRD
jgi:hypothetical protein